MEDEEKMSEGMAEYLDEKFPKGERKNETDNSDMADYISDKFDTRELPGNNKRKQTIPEMLKDIRNRRI